MTYTSPSSTNAGIFMSLQVVFLPSVIPITTQATSGSKNTFP